MSALVAVPRVRMVGAFSEAWLRRLEAAIVGGPVRQFDRDDRVWLVNDEGGPVEVATVRELMPPAAPALRGRVVSPASDHVAHSALAVLGVEAALVEDGGSPEALGQLMERVFVDFPDPVEFLDPAAPAKHALLAIRLVGAAPPAAGERVEALAPLRAAAAMAMRGDELEGPELVQLARAARLWPSGLLTEGGLPRAMGNASRATLPPGAGAVWATAAETLRWRAPPGFRPPPAPRPVLTTEPAPAGERDDAAEIERYRKLASPTPMLPSPCPREVRDRLKRNFPWLSEQIGEIVREIALLPGGAPARLPPLLLAGPPGSGKSTFLRRLYGMCGLPVRQVGVADGGGATGLAGNGRGWRGGRPALPLSLMAASGLGTVAVVVDDVDRQGTSDAWSTPQSWLLGAVDRAAAQRHWDPFLLAECDLSGVSWGLTCNDPLGVSGALRDRCLVLTVDYPPADVAEEVLGGILRQVERELGHEAGSFGLPEAAHRVLVRAFRANPGTLRALARVVRAVLGAARLGEDAVRVAEASIDRLSMGADDRPYAASSIGFGR